MAGGPDIVERIRWPKLDLARGLALAAMVVYHTAWDLSHLGLIETDIRLVAGWSWFAKAIAASFLAISGASLALAHADGLDRSGFLRRLALVGGAAGMVTAATYALFPQSFVFFGILHMIAVGSVLALPFLRLPGWICGVAAAITFVLPMVFRSDTFATPALVWLGLGTRVPSANDFVPVFPWFAFVLGGLATAKMARWAAAHRLAPVGRFPRVLSRAGRNSLAIYLLHQPLLFGGLSLAALVLVSPDERQARAFLPACQTQCGQSGGTGPACRALCVCALDDMLNAGLLAPLMANTLSAEGRSTVDLVIARCADVARGEGPKP